jgi:gluconokinase
MFVIVMGVSGCGKSTVGQLLAGKMGCAFYDGDDFHPAANIAKMSQGIPLNDDDRAGWLAVLADLIRRTLQKGDSGVLACSALKQKYRDVLCVNADQVKFVYLKGSYDLIKARMEARPGHYMKPGMLDSQFAALEEPADAVTVSIEHSPEEIADQAYKQLFTE